MSFVARFWQAFIVEMKEAVRIGDLSEGIRHAIEPQVLFRVPAQGQTLLLSDAVVTTWLALLILVVLGWWLARRRELMPQKMSQVLAEGFIELLYKLCHSFGMNDRQAETVIPYLGTISLFIAVSNLLSLFHIPPPAKNPAFPITLAILTILYVIAQSIRLVGLKGFLTSLTFPNKFMLPFKVMDYLIKPISLSLRLFGNVFGAFILMKFIYLIIPIIVPGILGIWFDLIDGLLQAVIFTYLTAMYLGEVLENVHMAAEMKEEREAAKALSHST